MKIRKAHILFPLLFAVACSNSEMQGESDKMQDAQDISDPQSSSAQAEPEIEGMLRLFGGDVTLGSNDKQFKASERPAMQVVLDYDFYMDIHEVTCGDYDAIAKDADLKNFPCKGNSLPIADVTYYDAILFANAKSRLSERDSVYTYNKATFDSEGHCIALEGLAFHPEIEGFRLPTEAEWVYAATRAWDTEKSWNNANSGFSVQEVCGAGADSAGFCDMAGNVMEWVNDWLGLFHDTTVTNYVGAPDAGDMGERIVKGGSYASSIKEMNPYSRGDVYTVTSATMAEYVGFRLALGSIPDPLWMGSEGKLQTSIVTPLAGSETVKAITGTYNLKLAFRNDITKNLAYIDYLSGAHTVNEIEDTLNVYHPDISPDGNYVAFCTGLEGVSGKSRLYVRKLDKDSTKAIKLDVESAAIPRWRVLENGDTAIVYVTDAGSNKDSRAFTSASTWQVTFKDEKFGTPQKLFDGTYHGGISEDNTLAVTGARLLRARIAKAGSTLTQDAQDVVWYDSAQACNASLAQDGSKRTAFLDFVGKPGKKFVGSDYSTHERLFIADSTGKLIQSIKAPNGYTFDHTEWATDGIKSNIVATLSNLNGAHTKIVLVNPEDSSVTDLAEGDELWHPALWVKKAEIIPDDTTAGFKLDPDSAGVYYNTSGVCSQAKVYRYKMEILWQYKDTANVVIMGASRALYGINPLIFESPVFAINLSTPAASLYGTSTYFYNYVLPHIKNMKVLILSIDLDRSYNIGRNANNMFHEAYKSYPGYVYDMNHNFWVDEYPTQLFNATYDSPGSNSDANKYRPTRGHLASSDNGWGAPTITEDSCWMDYKRDNYLYNVSLLKDLIDTCKNNGITLIGIIHPMNPEYAETGAFGYAGLRRSEVPAVMQDLSELASSHPNFILMDENKMGNHDYSDDEGHDYSHLSQSGAIKLTQRIDSLIQTLDIDFGQ